MEMLPIAILSSTSGSMSFFSAEALKVWAEMEISLLAPELVKLSFSKFDHAHAPTVSSTSSVTLEGYTIEQWSRYAKKKNSIASTVAKRNGELNARLAKLTPSLVCSLSEGGTRCGGSTDPMSLNDPWLGASHIFTKEIAINCEECPDPWAGWGRKLESDTDPVEKETNTDAVIEPWDGPLLKQVDWDTQTSKSTESGSTGTKKSENEPEVGTQGGLTGHSEEEAENRSNGDLCHGMFGAVDSSALDEVISRAVAMNACKIQSAFRRYHSRKSADRSRILQALQELQDEFKRHLEASNDQLLKDFRRRSDQV